MIQRYESERESKPSARRAVKLALVLFSLVLIMFGITAKAHADTTYYVDAITGAGSDSNPGTISAPWATLAHADSVLPTNYQGVQLKYPNGSWYAVPPVWHGFLSYYPYMEGTFAGSNSSTLYDVFNGHNGVLYGPSWGVGGVGLELLTGQVVTIPDFASFGPTSTGAFIVVQTNADTGNDLSFAIGGETNPRIAFTTYAGTEYWDFGSFIGGRVYFTPSSLAGQRVVWGALAGGNYQAIYQNATRVAYQDSNLTFTPDTNVDLTIGSGLASLTSSGFSQQGLLITDNVLSDSNYLTLENWLTQTTPPTVSSVSPSSGTAAGGTVVTVTGTNLTGATAVDFGTTPASTFTVNSSTSITATSPTGTGTVDVTVTTQGGTSATRSDDQFTFVLPPVTTEAASNVTSTGATLNGLNGPASAADTAFWFGTTSGGPFTPSIDPGGQRPSDWSGVESGSQLGGASFSYALTGLTPNIQYYFVVWSEVGGTWYPGAVLQFTPPLPPVTTEAASNVTSTGATLNGLNGPASAADTAFWFGTTSGGPFTPSATPMSQLPGGWINIDSGAQSSSASFSVPLTGLTPNIQYYFVVWSEVGGTWYPGAVLQLTSVGSLPSNGLAQVPMMGWDSWRAYAAGTTEAEVKANADAMVTNGMKAAGYQYVNPTDNWATGRGSNGTLITNTSLYPDGMQALDTYIHNDGLLVGTYYSEH